MKKQDWDVLVDKVSREHRIDEDIVEEAFACLVQEKRRKAIQVLTDGLSELRQKDMEDVLPPDQNRFVFLVKVDVVRFDKAMRLAEAKCRWFKSSCNDGSWEVWQEALKAWNISASTQGTC